MNELSVTRTAHPPKNIILRLPYFQKLKKELPKSVWKSVKERNTNKNLQRENDDGEEEENLVGTKNSHHKPNK